MLDHLRLAALHLVRGEFKAMWNDCQRGYNRTRCGAGPSSIIVAIIIASVFFASSLGVFRVQPRKSVNGRHNMWLRHMFKGGTDAGQEIRTEPRTNGGNDAFASGYRDSSSNGDESFAGDKTKAATRYDIEDLRLVSKGPEDAAEGAYLFKDVCMSFNTHNTLERTERGLVWFDQEYSHPKRCVPCSNPLISFVWQDKGYRDYWGELLPSWRKEGGLLKDVRRGDHGCGMMWVHKITVHNLTDYNACMELNKQEILDRGQVQMPKRAKSALYHHGTTLTLNWYHRNIGHQLFDSLTSLMPLLHPLFLQLNSGEEELPWNPPYDRVIAHQLPACDDSFYICNVLRRLGAFRGRELIPIDDDSTMHCFEKLIVPRAGYFGRQHEKDLTAVFSEFRKALFHAYELPEREAVDFPINVDGNNNDDDDEEEEEENNDNDRIGAVGGDRVPKKASSSDRGEVSKPRILFYRHASTARRVWLDAAALIRSFEAVFDVVDVYDFGKLSLKEQAEEFHRSDVMLMAHGAQFANVIFCAGGARVYEISCTGYSHVARALPPSSFGVRHESMSIQPCPPSASGDVLDSNFTIPEGMLLKRLKDDGVITQAAASRILSRFYEEKKKEEKAKVEAQRKKKRRTATTTTATTTKEEEKEEEEKKNEKKEKGKKAYSSTLKELPNAPVNEEYEKERWGGRFDMQFKEHANVSCTTLPSVVPRFQAYLAAARHVRDWEDAEMGKPRILCWAFTRTGFEERAYALQQTWGQYCDKLLFISNAVMPKLKTMVVELEDDSHDNLWQKMQLAIPAIYARFKGQFDWYYKIDDDTFALMGNMRKLLLSPLIQGKVAEGKGVYVGRSMDSRFYMKRGGCRFNVGGSGYVFDDIAMKGLSKHIADCFVGKMSSADDMLMGCCIEEKLGILPVDTRDSAGGERFHPFDPQFCSDYTLPKDKPEAMKKDWFYSYSLKPIKERMAHCAPDTVAWHHLPPHFVHQLWKLWNGCPELLARRERGG